MIQNEKEIISYLNLPSIPKKPWDGKKSFKNGIAVTKLISGEQAYAVASFDSERDETPRITKVFTLEQYNDFDVVAVVPDYMDVDNVEKWDVDEESKKAAQRLVDEGREIEEEGVEQPELPENEYCFSHIHNDEEGIAYIRAWNKEHGIKSKKLPKNHDAIVTKLAAMWMDAQKNLKK